MPVPAITLLFIAAVIASTLTRLWLAGRQLEAVKAHRERVPEPFAREITLAEHRKAADYTIARVRFASVERLVDAAVIVVLTLGGVIALVDAAWHRLALSELWLGAAVVATILLLTALIELPLSLWQTFRIEAAFGFNRSTLGLFFLDRLKGLLLAVLIGGPLLLGALALMQWGGRWWWLIAWVAWLAVTVALTWAWPAFIAPLFNRFSPLTDPSLKAGIEALLARCGFTSKGVFVVDGSRRSAHGNAYFTGVGRNKRVVFFDTLLERLQSAEIEAVLAHELGHFRLRHVRQRLWVSALGALFGLALLAWLARQPSLYAALGVPRPSPHTALLLFMVAMPPFSYFITPLAAAWSRRHERAADEFAAQHANASHLAAALVKLYRDNSSTLTPDRLHSAFYDSHPPALVRIAHLRALAHATGADA
jgi:STE24 endopeptidase